MREKVLINLEKRERKKANKARRVAWKLLRQKEAKARGSRPETYLTRWKKLQRLGFKSYQEYLASDLWQRIRAKVMLQSSGLCRLCEARATDVHHLSYGIDILRGDNLRPLVPLCRTCHRDVEFDGKGEKRTVAQAQVKYYQLWARARKLKGDGGLRQRQSVKGFCRVCGKKAKKKEDYCRPCGDAARWEVFPRPPYDPKGRVYS